MKEDSQSSKVYLELRKKILSNQLIPGTRLKEDAWATKIEVSRISVREALNRLLGEGLLEIGQRGGYYVKSMTAADLREIRQLREVLERGALRLAINNATSEDVTELERICDDFSLMVRNGYFAGACEADVRFHETLINIARNSKLKQAYEMSNIPLFHLKLGQSLTHMNDYELTDKEHREIVEALKSKDMEKAENFLIAHLNRGELTSLELA